jgi:CelD/BcsL family acetyltransferase involved in cellulose biosynthesis
VRLVESELIEDVGALERYRQAWDSLAVELSRPYCAPAWALAWWNHAAPPSAALKVIVAHEGGELVGIAPFYADRWGAGLRRYSLLAAESCWRVEPLARAKDRERVAEVIAARLHEARPAPDLLSFHYLEADSPWPRLVAHHWPAKARPRVEHDSSLPAPTVALEAGDIDAWLSSKSSNLRQQIRKKRRRLERAGAVLSPSGDPGNIERDVQAFFALHYGRWEDRGGSWVQGRRLEQAVTAAAKELVAAGRFRVASVKVDDAMIAVSLVIAAGGEAGYWMGGFDQEWTRFSPGLIAAVEAIEDGLNRAETRFDFGPGREDYKTRLADHEDRLDVLTLLPVGPRFPWVWLQLRARALINWLRRRREASG